jgi:hypothetical protein
MPVWMTRRRVAALVLASALALPVVLSVITAGSGSAVFLGFAIFAVVGAIAGPIAWPGESRFECLVTCLAGAVTLVVGGIAVLFVAFLSLCGGQGSDDSGTAVRLAIAVVAVAGPYLAGSAVALDDSDRARWAWPVVILLTLALAVAVTAVVEGGPHRCEP